MKDSVAVEIRKVSKRFPGLDGQPEHEVVAVDNVSLQILDGEFFSLLGPSGCGKTTTLRCIAGLEKPEDGDIVIDGGNSRFTDSNRRYAELAEAQQAEQFCVATELSGTIRREAEWRAVIDAVREAYSGPLVYASNHGVESSVAWWDALDYIGVDAYYPLTSSTDWTRMSINWMEILSLLRSRLSMSSPRRPRLRLSLSSLSAMPWSSARMNRGTSTSDSKIRVSATSATRPSMITDVSSTIGRGPLASLANST